MQEYVEGHGPRHGGHASALQHRATRREAQSHGPRRRAFARGEGDQVDLSVDRDSANEKAASSEEENAADCDYLAERATGLEPATACLGSRYSTN